MFECVSYSENLIMGRLKVVIILHTVHYWGIAVLSFNLMLSLGYALLDTVAAPIVTWEMGQRVNL